MYNSASMKAIVYTQYGTPDNLHLQEVNKPVPKENEVLIKVHASSINSWDWDLLKGKPLLVKMIGGLFKPKHQILGADIAGVVESVGADVKDFKPGDEVFGDIAESGFGGFAEYVCTKEKLLAKKSPAISFEEAAALPQGGLLALQGLHYKKPVQKGQQVLINGAGGGVGPIALQYAKLAGAEVTCVDKAEKLEVLHSLGADYLIDYKKEDYTANGKQYDYILDVIAHKSVADYKLALKPTGVFAMVGGSMGWLLFQMMLVQPILSKFRNKKLGIMGYKPNRKDLDLLNQLVAEKKMKPVIDKVFPLSETVNAFRHFESGNFKGKIIIAVCNG
jgi:NADPH:quinone reductase-like Zn-dependent oxidoreductase